MIIEMGDDITPETKVRLPLKDAIMILLGIGGFAVGALTYFGVIPNNTTSAQIVHTAYNCDACPNYVTREKLADTIIPLQLQIDNYKREVSEIKTVQKDMQSDIKEILKRLKDD